MGDRPWPTMPDRSGMVNNNHVFSLLEPLEEKGGPNSLHNSLHFVAGDPVSLFSMRRENQISIGY